MKSINELRLNYYFFDPKKYGRIFTFVDFGNVRPWAKKLWPEENKNNFQIEIDIEKLYEVCSWVSPQRNYFYYGHYHLNDKVELKDDLNEKYRKSIFRINKAKKIGFRIRTKEIKMIPHYNEEGQYLGKIPKCNFDVEITMDMINLIEKYDTLILYSGDSDFDGLLDDLKYKGKKIVVVCVRDGMSKELEKVADIFVPADTLKDYLYYKKTLRQ